MADAGDWFAAEDRAAIDDVLADVATVYWRRLQAPLGDAVAYSLLGGGKRLRGLLLLAAYRAAGGQGDATRMAAAVEVIHAYSLVHDDLPCMDDEGIRRGRPTVHRKFGVHAATVAGLVMVPVAVCCAAEAAACLRLPGAVTGRIVRELMQASGAGGMIGGQLLDLDAEGKTIDVDALERVHLAKTGALIAACAQVGGIAAGVGHDGEAALARYGQTLGLAFQITDDVLDVTGTTDELGKTAGRDATLGKSTYPGLLGVEIARLRAAALANAGCAALDRAGLLTPPLAGLARFAVERRA